MRGLFRFLLPMILLFPASAEAWGPEGHAIITQVAADNLTPAAHLRLSQILGGDAPAQMVLNSSWADEIRNDRPQTAAWHFVNIEVDSNGYDQRRDCPKDNCVVRQIEREAGLLKDPRAPFAAKRETLLFLIHFVGDLHQPLHAADRHDKGGNGFMVYQERKRTNLHRVWDQDLVEALGPDPSAIAADIEAEFSSAEKVRVMSGKPADWANETFLVGAKEIYAKLPAAGPVRLPRDYASRERAVVRQQLGRAGLRLAMLLNAIYR
ncbi:MAG TPA: S1/P1 nuclease [Rhizomicrobium sp.]|jgi:hypothetical protein|nr:S1/P1 nuclease [Rhizomicrobium sp.]